LFHIHLLGSRKAAWTYNNYVPVTYLKISGDTILIRVLESR